MTKRIVIIATLILGFQQSVALSEAKISATKRAIECKKDVDCPYFSEVFISQSNIQKKLLQSFAIAGVKTPEWLKHGTEHPTYPIIFSNQTVLIGHICEPHNCGNQVIVAYNLSSGRLVGIWVEEDTKIIWLGEPTSDERKLLKGITDPFLYLPISLASGSDISVQQSKELAVFFGRAMGKQVEISDIKDVPDQTGIKEMVKGGLNLNSLLCAEIVRILPLELSGKYEVTCVAYGGGNAQKTYIVDSLSGRAFEQ